MPLLLITKVDPCTDLISSCTPSTSRELPTCCACVEHGLTFAGVGLPTFWGLRLPRLNKLKEGSCTHYRSIISLFRGFWLPQAVELRFRSMDFKMYGEREFGKFNLYFEPTGGGRTCSHETIIISSRRMVLQPRFWTWYRASHYYSCDRDYHPYFSSYGFEHVLASCFLGSGRGNSSNREP